MDISSKNKNEKTPREQFYSWKKIRQSREPRETQCYRRLEKLKGEIEEADKKHFLGSFLNYVKLFIVDHIYIVLKSPAHNYLRIQKFKKNNVQERCCNLNFSSYTALKHYQKKVRLFTFSTSSTVASVLVASIIVQIIAPSNFAHGATFHFQQTNWGALGSNDASHNLNQTGWTEYSAKDAGITAVNGGNDLQLQQVASSTTQTSDTDFNAGTKTDTAVNRTGNDAFVQIDHDLHANEYTVGHLANISVTVTTVGFQSPWLLTLSGTPNLGRIFKNDKFIDSSGKAWKVLSLNPSTSTPRLLVIDSEGNGGSPVGGAGTVGRWYPDLAAWEIGREGDLVARKAVERALPYYDVGPDTSPLTIDGWVTDATHYVEINVPFSERHRGKWDDNRYRLEMDPGLSGFVLRIIEEYVKVNGLQIKKNSTGNTNGTISIFSPTSLSNVEISSNIVVSAKGVGIGCNYGTCRIYNNVVYDNSGSRQSAGIRTETGGESYIYDNTVYDASTCFYNGSSESTLKNNIAQNCSDGFNNLNLWNASSTNNLSDLAGDAPGSNPQNSKTVTFVDAANKDFHLEFNDTAAKNAGSDLSADASLPITTDIDGDTRTSAWDIGADDVGSTYVHVSSIGTNGRDFSTLQSWEDARDGVLTTRNVFKIAAQNGIFTEGETITGTSGATGIYIPERAVPSASEKYMTVDVTSGTFLVGDALTGASSGKTATLSSIVTDSGTIEKGEAYNDSIFTQSININNSTTDVAHYMWLTVEPRSRHWGVDGTGATIKLAASQQFVINFADQFSLAEWLTVDANNYNASGISASTGGSYSSVRNNIVKNFASSNDTYSGIYVYDYSTINNNIVYSSTAGAAIAASYGTSKIYNNTTFNSNVGFLIRSTGPHVAVNNIAANSTTGFSASGATWSASSSNNVSFDATSPGSNSKINQTLADIKFVSTDPSLIDLHITPGSVALNSGADLSANFKNDLDGDVRLTGANTWDIGADEWHASSPIYKSWGSLESSSIDLGVKANLNSINWNPIVQNSDTKIWTEIAANNDNSTWNYKSINEHQYPSGVTVDEKLVRQDCTGFVNCYTTVIAALAAYTNKDLVAQNKVASIKIDGLWSIPENRSSDYSLNTWTTGPDNYIRIYTTEQARHNGKWNERRYRMRLDGPQFANVFSIGNNSAFIRIDGLQIENISLSGSALNVSSSATSGDMYFSNNIIKGPSEKAIYISGGQHAYIWNNIVYDWEGSGIEFAWNTTNISSFVYNNTISNIQNNWGIDLNGTTVGRYILKNNVVQNTNEGYSGSFDLESANNISDDISSPNVDFRNKTVSFIDAANKDFSLSFSDNSAKDNGVDLSADTNFPLSVDMQGHFRNVGAWDIGALEYGSSGGIVPVSLNGNRYVRYRVYFDTDNISQSPLLSDMTLNYTSYPASATITSSPFDTTDAGNILAKMQWTETISADVTDVTFQVRTSSDGGLWTSWVGPDGTSSTEFSDPSGGEILPTIIHDGSEDRYFQYKAILHSDGTATPTLSDADFTYVVNAAPQVQNVTGIQNTDGTVSINYDVRDPDTSTGILNGYVNTTLKYCTANCATPGSETWTDATTISGDIGSVAVQEGDFTNYSIIWIPKTDYANQYNANMKIRIVANDNEAANNLASVNSNNFVLDTKNPNNVNLDINHSLDSDQLILSSPIEDSAYQMAISNYADFHDVVPTAFNSPVTFSSLTTDPATVYLRIIDSKGNYTDTSSTTPLKPQNVVYYDISNSASSDYREFIAWSVIPIGQSGSGFGSYEIYRSTDNQTSFVLIGTISDRLSNFYMDNTVDGSHHYYYKLITKDINGNVSAYSSLVDDTPNGQGGSDSTAPTISSIQVTNIDTTSATITWVTDEISDSSVGYSIVQTYLPEMGIASLVTDHRVTLTGLAPDTTYNLRLKSRDIVGNLTTNDADAPGGNPIENFQFTTNPGPAISQITIPDVSNQQANISWKTSTNSTTVVQYSATILNGNLISSTEIGTPELVKNHNQVIASLTPNTRYYFQVKSIDSMGNVATDNNGGNFYQLITTQDIVAPVITNFSEVLITSESAAIQWSTDEPANSKVEYGKVSDSLNDSQVVTTYDNSHFVILPSLEADTIYYYKVISKDINGNEQVSAEKNFKTLKDATFDHDPLTKIIFAEKNPSVLTDQAAVITFVTDQAAKCFAEYGTASGTFNAIPVLESNFNVNHDMQLLSLLFKTKYFYKITCRDNLGTTVTSDEFDFTTREQLFTESGADALGDHAAPVINSTKVESVTGESVTVTWDTDEKSSSSVRYGTDVNYGNTAGNDLVNSNKDNYVTSHTVTIPGLVPAAKYFFKVLSVDLFGNIAESSQFDFTTASPSALSSIKVESKNLGQATITWKTNQNTSSIVEYGLSTSYGEKKEDTSMKKDHSVDLTSLNQGTTYHYRVKGKDDSGRLFSSSDNTFEPKSPPKVFSALINEVYEHEAMISFVTDIATDASIVYTNVEDKTDAGSQGKPELSQDHKIKLVNLQPGITYATKIIVRDEQGTQSETTGPDFTTGIDHMPPKIEQVRTESALTQSDKVQSIISWKTDEQSNSSIVYKEGVSGEEKEFKITDNLTTFHVAVITAFKSGSVYNFKVKSVDASGNVAISSDYALLTPRKRENIIQIIVNNFTEIFSWAQR